MLIIPLLAVLLLWYLITCYKWKKNIFDHIQKLPGDKWYPFFGTTYKFIGVSRPDIFYKVLETAVKHGPLFRTWNGNHPEVNIAKPEHLQEILRRSVHMKKGIFYDFLYEWLGDGLLISKGAKWFLQRKLLTPAFHFKILENFMGTFHDKCGTLVDNLAFKVGDDYFDILPMITSCTLDVVCETAMGVPADAITTDKMGYVQSLYDMTEMAVWRNMTPYWRWHPMFYIHPQGRKFRKSLSELHTFSRSVIAERKKLRDSKLEIEDVTENTKKKRLSFLDIVIDATDKDTNLTDRDLQSLVDTILFAGFDTTTASTCWSLFLLGNYPDVQEKVFQEIREVLGDKPRATTIEELNKLKYMECVIKEGLRLFPVLGFITRKLSEDIELDGYKIPKGVDAICQIAMVHRDPEQFPEPNKFIPERFLPENSKTRHPYAFIPFSAGPRNCIGQRFALLEEKMILSSIINRYKLTSLEKQDEIKLFVHTLIRPQHGIKVKLELRED